MLDKDTLLRAYRLMCTERAMAAVYDENRSIAHYVHSTSRGHEAIQLATAFHLEAYDYVSPYYRDDSILLGLGLTPYEVMLQLLAKRDDPFTGGRSYYSHPNLLREGFPTIPHQTSATGMQAIPTTGLAQGVQFLEERGLLDTNEKPVVVCSLGDGAITEGEVSEAFQEAVLHQLPILYLIQDNQWGISVSDEEMAAMTPYEFAAGFKGMKRSQVDGADFSASYEAIRKSFQYIRKNRKPMLLHATCPLLGHHTSGVRREYYRDEEDWNAHHQHDPIPVLEKQLKDAGIGDDELKAIDQEGRQIAEEAFQKASTAPDPDPSTLHDHAFAPTPVEKETGTRAPSKGKKVVMVDAALHAIQEIMEEDERTLLYGQDVGRRLGGVFREAATLAEKFGDDRVFNTPIQEAYIIGSTVGMSAAGAKAFVEVQFCDYIWPGINQLATEVSKSGYLSMGKFPVNTVIRVPLGAYGGGGPYHSGSYETAILGIKGLKVAYPVTSADMKGLMKAAYQDPNPVIMLEHKGLYWSKVPGTKGAQTAEPDRDYVLPFGKARLAMEADKDKVQIGDSMCVVTYGVGVYWAMNAAEEYPGKVTVLDLRTLNPMDHDLIYETVQAHGKCLVLTEEPIENSFARSLAGLINEQCFQWLDAPVFTMGASNLPAIPLNVKLEEAMLPNANKVAEKLGEVLAY